MSQLTTSLQRGGTDATLAEGFDAEAQTRLTPLPTPAPGELFDRYVILERIGAGAMGVVLAAYDPKLNRKVALKLLTVPARDQDAAHQRLQREAQALARLDHPNVIGVYDVGSHRGRLYVAMELVDGQTLSQWMRAGGQPRPWREVLRVFMAAGHGLAAAHGAELVHRDFKPDNVMIGAGGRVRVMDFGLARAEDEFTSTLEDVRSDADAAGLNLTTTGMLLGTPAYMALEQLTGQGADPRSDQFAFCVALHEALYGQRPFAADNLAALIAEVRAGAVRSPPRGSGLGSGVPGWVRAVVVRGLSSKPEDRFESMTALLDALGRDPTARRRDWVVGIGLIAILAGSAWGLTRAVQAHAPTCAGMADKLAGVWDDARAAAAAAAFEASERSYASATWARVDADLDRYAQQWVEARTGACQASERGEQSDALLDLRMACLDERLTHLDALVELLATADATVVDNAIEAVASLPPLERCADAKALLEALPPPDDPTIAARVAEVDVRLVKVAALTEAGKFELASSLARDAFAEAEATGHEPVVARAGLRLGRVQKELGEHAEAEATLRRTYDLAVGQRMTVESAWAAVELVGVLGHLLARPEDAHRWAEHAAALARASGSDEIAAELESNLGLVRDLEGEYAKARAHHERSLELFERALGPDHPKVALAYNNLGTVAMNEGKPDEARSYHERALELQERVLGPDHPELMYGCNNVAVALARQGDLEHARAYAQRAIEIGERALGPEHPTVGALLDTYGGLAFEDGDLAVARASHERALAIAQQALGPEHADVGYSLYNLATVARAQGEHADARQYFLRAVWLWEQALGHDHVLVAHACNGLGYLLVELREYPEAIAQFERALAIREAQHADPHSLANTREGLSDALWNAELVDGRDRPRARELAERAREEYRVAEAPDQQAEIEAWLASHRLDEPS